jgi:carbon monoxide dehydrogenase subunit G
LVERLDRTQEVSGSNPLSSIRQRTVRGEVLEVEEPRLLRFSWQGSANERPTEVTWLIEPEGLGTRLTYTHTRFSGLHGQVMSRLLGRVRRKMLSDGLPPRALRPGRGGRVGLGCELLTADARLASVRGPRCPIRLLR